ncbi:hypothetical protein RRG08_029315 [Elysia crispata]|uniref:Uncharacterized protein n=1 Tax=Elysia crispata TaxID=231223 RepID=A0AAE1A643_9GAST|nr:hypothetical protein RRG08_029315 [Elysia crispata]
MVRCGAVTDTILSSPGESQLYKAIQSRARGTNSFQKVIQSCPSIYRSTNLLQTYLSHLSIANVIHIPHWFLEFRSISPVTYSSAASFRLELWPVPPTAGRVDLTPLSLP